MPRIGLELARVATGLPYFYPGDRSGAAVRFPTYRLYLYLAFVPRDYAGGHPLDHPGVVSLRSVLDTGAPLSVFPFPAWSRFPDYVRWLDQPPAPVSRRLTILGGTFPYRLGRVKVGAVDRDRRWLPVVTLTGLFLDNVPGGPGDPVLGLRSRLLDGRQLRHEPAPDADPDQTPGRWWLEDPAPPVSR